MSDPQIKYDINADVSGSEKIEALAAEMDALKRSVDKTSESAAIIAKLEAALRELANQQAAIENFRQLKKAVDDADTAFLAAQTIAQGLGAELGKTANASAAQRGEFERARTEVHATKKAWEDSVVALSGVRKELTDSGVNTKNLSAEQVQLGTNIKSTSEQLKTLKDAIANAGTGMTQAKVGAEQTGAALEQAFKVLGVKSVQSVEDEINKLRAAMQVIRQSGSFMSPDSLAAADALKTKVAALEAELKGLPPSGAAAAAGIRNVGTSAEGAQASIASATLKVGGMVAAMAGITSLGDVAKNVIQTGASFETLRVRLDQLLGSQQKSADAFEMIKKLATSTPFEVNNLTEAYAKLTTFGLNPTERQMRALADTAAAAGGGQQMLERVSIALGQAWAKQKLQGDEILQLTEAGVPVWDLLAVATGKNVTELQRLSEAGALGRDVITQLFAAMGEKNAGASERLMRTFAGSVSNAKDAMAEFFDLVSRSGVLDYLTQQIQAVLVEFERLKNNGELQAKAKAISDAVIAMSDALKGAVGLVNQFSFVIEALLARLVVTRIAAFGASLVGLGASATIATVELTAASIWTERLGLRAAQAVVGVGLFAKTLASVGTGLVVGGVIAALSFLYDKLMAAKRAAEEGDRKVAEMLNQTGTGAAAKAVANIGLAVSESEKAVVGLKNEIGNLGGEGLAAAEKRFRESMRAMRADTKDVQSGLVEIGLQAGKSLGVDVLAASNRVGDSFKESNFSLNTLIATLPNLAKHGVDTALVVGKAIAGMIDGAKSQAEIEAIKTRLTELGQRGYQTGQQIEAGMKLAADKGAELKISIATWGLGFADVGKAAGKAGVDIGELTTGVAKNFKESVVDVDNLAKAIKATGVNAETAGPQLAKALDQRLQAAQTKQEVELVIAEYKKLGEQGLLTGDNLKEGLQKSTDKLSSMTKGVNDLREAYAQLGLKTPEELKKIADANGAAWDKIKTDSAASVETLKAAFNTYAQSAIAASGNVGSEQRQRTQELLAQEAALKGLTVTFDENGKMVVQTQAEAAAAIDKTTGALRGQKGAVDEVTAALEKQNAAQEKKIAALEKENDLKKRAIDLENKRLNRDSEGFALDDQGKRRVEYQETERSLFDRIKAQGGNDLTEAQVLELVQRFYRDQNPVNYLDLTKEINATVMRNIKARAQADGTLGGASAASTQGVPSPDPSKPLAQPATAQPAPAPAPVTPVAPIAPPTTKAPVTASESSKGGAASTITHKFEIGGKSTSVGVASDGDSANLLSVIQQLKSARMSANG